jgi:MFS family permease
MLVITLQLLAGFSPTAAGAALLPVTGLMLVLSGPAGSLGQRTGPRLPLTLGPLLSTAGTLLLVRVDSTASYLTDVLPGVALFGLGLSVTVAPLTATVLAAAPLRHAGLASGVNNAVARSAGLLIVAALPGAVGLSSATFGEAASLQTGYSRAMLVCAALLAVGAGLGAVLIRPHRREAPGGGEAVELALPVSPCRVHCAVGGPPLQPESADETAAT